MLGLNLSTTALLPIPYSLFAPQMTAELPQALQVGRAGVGTRVCLTSPHSCAVLSIANLSLGQALHHQHQVRGD